MQWMHFNFFSRGDVYREAFTSIPRVFNFISHKSRSSISICIFILRQTHWSALKWINIILFLFFSLFEIVKAHYVKVSRCSRWCTIYNSNIAAFHPHCYIICMYKSKVTFWCLFFGLKAAWSRDLGYRPFSYKQARAL